MIYAMCAEIVFAKTDTRGEVKIYKPSRVKIESSFKNFTNIAYIVLPRNVGIFQRKKVTELFKTGDPVTIKLGYNGNLFTEFEGYVTNVNAGVPVEIRCENEMYKLKQGSISVSMPKATVKQLLQKIVPDYEIDCPDMQLGSVRYSQIAPIKILEQLKQKTGLYSYFDGKVLRCGVYYADQSKHPAIDITLERNAVDKGSNNLNKKEVAILVKAISQQLNGKVIQVTVGDKGGILNTMSYRGITDKTELEKAAKLDYEKIKAGCLEGTLELFGLPRVVHGQKINIKSLINPDLNGVYYADKVDKEFNDNATYRQRVELSTRISNE